MAAASRNSLVILEHSTPSYSKWEQAAISKIGPAGEDWPEFLKKQWKVRKGLWLATVRNSLASVMTFYVLPEDQVTGFVEYHNGSPPPIAATGLGPVTGQPVVSTSSVIDFELGYGGALSMKDSAMLVLRGTLSETADAFVRWKQRVIFERETMFPGLSKAFACQPTENTILFVAVFPQVHLAAVKEQYNPTKPCLLRFSQHSPSAAPLAERIKLMEFTGCTVRESMRHEA